MRRSASTRNAGLVNNDTGFSEFEGEERAVTLLYTPTRPAIYLPHDEIVYDKRRKELQGFPRDPLPSGSETEYGEPAVRSLFRNSGISNCLVLIPGDRVEGSNHLATESWKVSEDCHSRGFL